MYKDLKYISQNDISNKIFKECISIPSSSNLTIEDQHKVISEIKNFYKNIFDESLSPEEIEKLRDFVKNYGDLKADGTYQGTIRGGIKSGGMVTPSASHEPIELRALLDSNFWRSGLVSSENPDWGDPLMEISGGMDGIVKAFVEEIRSEIVTNAHQSASPPD